MNVKNHSLDLSNNSISFFREAVSYAETGGADSSQWKFAVINLVQAMELALKEALRRIHPVFIYENIDSVQDPRTISISRAIERLRDERIGNYSISDAEKKNFNAAIKLRNEFVHYEFAGDVNHVESKFADIFSFMIFFYEKHLNLELNEFITKDQYDSILSMKATKAEMLLRAKEYINNGDVGETWGCPTCSEDTFIVDQKECCLCRHKEEIQECHHCTEQFFQHDLHDITDLFDYAEDEGRYYINSDYGFDYEEACESCVREIKESINAHKYEQYMEEMAMEDYYAEKQARS